LLIEHHQERLRISREIGHRPMEAHALMQCGQTLGLYLGDYQAGLTHLEACQRLWEGTPNEMFAWLRIAQIHAVEGRYPEALKALEQVNRIIGLHAVQDLGHAGLCLVSAILYNALGHRHTTDDEKHLRRALEFTASARRLVADAPLTRQYEMAAACESAMAHLRLAQGRLADESERDTHLRHALESSQTALDIYQHFGFVQVIECISEEILHRHSLTLAANGNKVESDNYLRLAYQEMMRKHALIPPDSSFRSTFLENIAMHREIGDAVAALPQEGRDER